MGFLLYSPVSIVFMNHNVVYVFVILVDDVNCVAIHDFYHLYSQRCFPLSLGDLTTIYRIFVHKYTGAIKE